MDAARALASMLSSQKESTIPVSKVAIAAGEVAGATAIREKKPLKTAEYLASSAATHSGGSKSVAARTAGLVVCGLTAANQN